MKFDLEKKKKVLTYNFSVHSQPEQIAATREKWKESSARLKEESAKLPGLQAALNVARTEYDKVTCRNCIILAAIELFS
jgi:hypothetical protein